MAAGALDRDLLAVAVDHDVVAGRVDHVGADQVGLAEEVRHERGGGVLVELAGCAHLLDHAVVHHRDGVGHGHGLLLVVGDVHERDADLGLDPLELDLHLAPELEVEGPERLVEQQHAGLVDQGAAQRDALLLPAGEQGRLAVLVAAELDQLDHVGGLLLVVGHPTAPQSEGDVLADRQVREQRIGLEHGVDRALVRSQLGDVLVADQHASERRVLEPRHHPQRGGLPAARRAEQREEGSLGDRERQVVDRDEAAEPLRHVLQVEVLALSHQ